MWYMPKIGAQEFKKAFEEAMEHNETLLAEDEKSAESTGEETPAQAAARESSAKVGTHAATCAHRPFASGGSLPSRVP